MPDPFETAIKRIFVPKAKRIHPSRMPLTLAGFVRVVSLRDQILISALSIVVFLLSTAPLEVQRRIVNDALDGGGFHRILVLCLAYAALAFVEGATKLVMNIYRGWIGEVAVLTLRESVGVLSEEDHDEPASPEETGVETSMMLAESEPIAGFVGVFLSEPLLQGGMLLSVFGYMLYLQPWMAAVAFLIFSPQIIFVPLMQRAINQRVGVRIQVLREVSVTMAAIPSGPRSHNDAQQERVEAVFRLNMGIFTLKFTMNFLMNLLHHFGTAGVLAVGGYLVLQGRTEVGVVVAFISGLAKINDPWGDLVNWFRDLTVTATKYDLIAEAIRRFARARTAS